MGEHGHIATRHDGHRAAQRNDDAGTFNGAQMLAEKGPGNGDGGDRHEGVEQIGVGRARILQGDVGKGVVAANAEQAKHGQRLPADEPAPEGHGQRRDITPDAATDHHVS